MNHAVELMGVSRAFGMRRALDGLNLTVPKGVIYGLLGPNGAGKTTVIRLITGILDADSGQVRILGGLTAKEARSRVSYLPEERGLYKKLSVLEHVAYIGMLKGLERAQARERASRCLSDLGLQDRLGARCESLSKGLAQKAQIAASLVNDPDIIILDEPFSGLDPVNLELVTRAILQLRNAGRTVILSTHLMDQAQGLCDYAVFINQGRKLLDGPISELRATFGRSVCLEFEGDGAVLDGLPGVTRVNNHGRYAELTLAEAADPQSLLKSLVPQLVIRRFEVRSASLHEIFVRCVGGNQT